MSYGIFPVHHLEHKMERQFLFFKKPYLVGIPVWNDSLPAEKLSGIERKVDEAFFALDKNYGCAFNGKVEVHPRRTCVNVHLDMEDDLKEKILSDYLALAGVPDWFQNVDLDFLNKILSPYGKRLNGFFVVDNKQAA